MKKKACASSSVWRAKTVGRMVLVAGGLLAAHMGKTAFAAPIAPDAVPDGGAAGANEPFVIPSASPNLPVSDQRLIDLEFKDTPVREVLGIISKYANINVVVGEDVTGNVSVYLGGIAPENAIKAVARAMNLKFRKYDDGTYIVGRTLPADEDTAPTIGAKSDVPSSALTAPGMGTPNTIPSLFNDTAEPDPNRIVGTKIKHITLRYVRPSLMAYWLDRQHQPVPYEIKANNAIQANVNQTYLGRLLIDPREQALANSNAQGSTGGNFYNPYGPPTATGGALGQFGTPSPYFESNNQFGGGFAGQGGQGQGGLGGGQGRNGGNGRNGGGGGQDGFDLPQGVQRLVVVDPQNTILVQTQDDAVGVTGFNELRDLIALLDQPLKQVEIEAQFVRVNTTARRTFSSIFSTSNGTFSANFNPLQPAAAAGGLTANLVRRNFQYTLQALAQNGQVKVVQSPRVTAINNLTATVVSSVSLPITTQTVQGGGPFNGIGTGQTVQYITLPIQLTVTPTINNDGTVTVVLSPQITAQNGALTSTGAPPIATSAIQTVAIVRDGDTIALGGLRAKTNSDATEKVPILGDIPIIGGLFRSRNRQISDDDLIIFLTARIVRRSSGDDSPVLGADTTNAPQ